MRITAFFLLLPALAGLALCGPANAATYRHYAMEGGLDEFFGTGVICDLEKPFTIEGSGVVMEFVPASARHGTYSYQGVMSGFRVFGEGTYEVRFEGDLAQGIVGTGPGSVETPIGIQSAVQSETYTLSPVDDARCP